MAKVRYWVRLCESERGWGQKYEKVYFDTYEAAKKAIETLDKQNQDDYKATGVVPDWYMQYEGDIHAEEF